MSKQVVLITGALTGIGRATAIAFAAGGANVVVAGRRQEDGKKLEKELRELGAEAQFVKVDVRHEPELRSLIDETVKRFGRLDVAVNNAGTEGAKGDLLLRRPPKHTPTHSKLTCSGCC
jgi:NAD(P)-dependent dehydrogenase (short-subunit alcohol dehydrogenase family)